jgi:hypothetical protein
LAIGVAGLLRWLDLPQALQVTQSPWVLGVSGALALVEFFADKIPGVDSGWDLLHTLLRVPTGAFLAAAAISPDGTWARACWPTGAGVALASHGLKAGTRCCSTCRPSRSATGRRRHRGHHRRRRSGDWRCASMASLVGVR